MPQDECALYSTNVMITDCIFVTLRYGIDNLYHKIYAHTVI